MSHATIHATLAARDVLTIPSPPWRSRIVSTRGRLRFRGRADYWQKYHSRSWKTARGRRRLGFPVQRAHSRDDVGTAVPAQGQRNRKADSIINAAAHGDRKSTRLNSSHSQISYAVFCLKKKKRNATNTTQGVTSPST